VKNQLVGINGPGVNATFVYDGLGRRQRKIVNGNSIEFLYDGLNPVQELNGSSVLTNMLTGLGIDEVFARSNASGAQYLLPDVIGSVIAVADSTATIHTEYTYEPFGRTTSSGNSVGTPFQFTGRENDETGLYFYRARYYDPQLQRFISQDRIFNLMSPNRYGYALDNPLRFVDRDGNSPVAVALCLACLATLPLAAAAGCVSGCLGSCNFTDCLKDCLDLKQTNPTLSTIATLLCGVVCAAAGIPDDTTEDPGNGPDPGKQNPAPTPDQDFEYKKAA
jgi:RHS repeat-associated protein